ncbi:MAG TPA: hypothetical protein VIP46_20760 [Pyrinomonadaceae bacterium]
MTRPQDDVKPSDDATSDERYIELLLAPIRECAKYRPAFGKGKSKGKGDSEDESDVGDSEEGVTVEHFRVLYGADLLYHWVGLDSDLMYAAHKAAGGMTSIYRQLGIGCERLLREIVRDKLGLSEDEVKWSYDYEKEPGKTATHTLDLRIDINDLSSQEDKNRLAQWLMKCGELLKLQEERAKELRGVVMEIRQGYKSADSKRQNADLRFGLRAYNEEYLPAIVIVSSQVSEPVSRRYRNALLLVLTGTRGDATQSTFAFFKEVVGYDLAAFFERNSPRLRAEFGSVLKALLSP